MKNVVSVKLAEIEKCSLGGADRVSSGKKSENQKYKRYDDLKWVVLKFKKRLFFNI